MDPPFRDSEPICENYYGCIRTQWRIVSYERGGRGRHRITTYFFLYILVYFLVGKHVYDIVIKLWHGMNELQIR